jgi:hypothetical protein
MIPVLVPPFLIDLCLYKCDKEILRLVTEGKSEATRKKYKAMIEQIVSLSGENTLQLALKP